jgi:cell wall-associated NlpC family hydrolase
VPSSSGPTRRVRATLIASIIVVAAAFSAMAPASADPAAPPANASEAVRQLTELNATAFTLTESMYAAQDTLDRRRGELSTAVQFAHETSAAARDAEVAASANRQALTKAVNSAYQGVPQSSLGAVLVADSPQQLLDQMVLLDRILADRAAALADSTQIDEEARNQLDQARQAQASAAAAEADAARTQRDLEQRRTDLADQIAKITDQLAALTDADRAAIVSPGTTNPSELPAAASAASGTSAQAMRIALDQLGKPYSWGATGPGSFDCSGLIYFAYKQLGLTVPRVAADQAQAGTPVSRESLQPGDFISLYSPIGHIGIYIGDGKYVNAPTGGDVVKVAPVPWDEVTAMNRPTTT